MTFLKFDDSRIKKAFNRITSMDNNSGKIDSDRERDAVASLISGVSHQISKHDLALLKSGSLNFDNKDVKKDFKNSIDKNGNRKIDTEEEFNAVKKYLEENSDNLNNNDKNLLTNMMDSFSSSPKVVVNVIGTNNKVQVTVGDDNTTTITEKPKEAINDSIKVIEDIETTKAKTPEEENDNQPIATTKQYEVKKGDYWYRMVKENYNTSSEVEVKQIIRKFKDEYFNKNKASLIKQGYTSSKSGFFLKVGEKYDLPTQVEVDGKIITIRVSGEN